MSVILNNQKINFIELFAGCGGLHDGFERTDFYNTLACVEWEKEACENLINRLHTKWNYDDANERVLRFDIQRTDELIHGWINDEDYGTNQGLAEIVANDSVDLITGGPPCQAYSVAGRIQDGHGMKNDYRNYLFESYLKVVDYFKPKVVVFENVEGLLTATAGEDPVVDLIKKAFLLAGYALVDDFKEAVIDLSNYGVPQKRKRVILVGLNKKYFHKNTHKILRDFYTRILPNYRINTLATVRDAIADLPEFYPSEKDYKYNGRKYSHTPSYCIVPNHVPRYHNRRDMAIFKDLAYDIETKQCKYDNIEILKQLYTERTGKTSNIHKYYVLRWNEPSNTIPAHLRKDGLRHIHPDYRQARSITVREAARLQTFEDDYIFTGSMTNHYTMIGNAVPPHFSHILAQAIRDLFQII